MTNGEAASSDYNDNEDDGKIRNLQSRWERRIAGAKKRQRKFIDQGDKVDKRFKGETASSGGNEGLNLFHTNVTTVKAMLFGQLPQIDVAREHLDPDDDVARVSSVLLKRYLESDVSASGNGVAAVYANALDDRLIPGLGMARVRYEFDPNTLAEIVHTDYTHWRDVLWGWCRDWSELPWIAFRAYLDKSECEERFGELVAKNMTYNEQSETDKGDDNKSGEKKAEIWEIWDKKTLRVYWFQAGLDKLLDSKADPLGLDGFWPCPKPMLANTTTANMMPMADYVVHQDIYNEIDILYQRISKITEAVRVVGVYDQSAGNSVGRMLNEGTENELIPVENWAMFAEKGGMRGLIDWFPVEQVVATLQTLRQVLSEMMQLLYEVTGMSDILRGANTDQYTSDGTQQLKAKFGSIRFQALQDEFARFCSDLAALKAEVACKHFSIENLRAQSGANFLPMADKRFINPALDLLQSPDVKYRINIKPESVSMIDYAQMKAERTEFLMSMAQYIQSAQAMASQVPDSLPLMLEMLKWGMAGFKGSDYLEGIMDQAIEGAKNMGSQQGQDKGPSPEQMRLQTEQIKQQTVQMKSQGDLQKIQAKAQADMQNIQAKVQGEIAKIRADADRDQALEDQQSQYALLEIGQELDAKLAEIRASLDSALTIESHQADEDMRVNDQEHMHRMREIGSASRGEQ